MQHAVLGAGGIGGLVGAALARIGAGVVLLMRPDSLSWYPGRMAIESDVLGNFEVDVPAAAAIEAPIDVLWVTVKATGLESALELAMPASVGAATVIPLLNGVDHVALLRARYPNVVAGAIRVESERVAPGRIRQTFPFFQIDLAGAESIVPELREAGFEVHVQHDEVSLLWRKLAFLAPAALATSAFDGPLGAVRDDERYLGCLAEVIAVAHAEGVQIDEGALRKIVVNAPPGLRSSMQKDVEAGRPPELDAIAGPIQRGGSRHGIPTPSTDELARLVDRAVRERAAETD